MDDQSDKSIHICNHLNLSIDKSICTNICHNQCIENYYKIILETELAYATRNSTLVIKSSNANVFVFKAQKSLSIAEMTANIGGIFALYLNLSFLDLTELIIKSNRIFSLWLAMLLEMNLIIKLKMILRKLKIIFICFDAIQWRKIITLISLPIILFQMYHLIDDYFEYLTKTSYEFPKYNKYDNMYSSDDFPAITVCNDNILDKVLFDDNIKVYENLYRGAGEYRINISWKTKSFNISKIWNTRVRKFIMILFYFRFAIGEQHDKFFLHENRNFIMKFMVNNFLVNTKNEYYEAVNKLDGLNGSIDFLKFYIAHYTCYIDIRLGLAK